MPTEREAAERMRVAANHDTFRELADNAPVLIWRSGPDKLCDFFNQTWLEFTGRSMADEIGMGWTQGVHPDDYERCLETYARAFEARESFSMEYRLRRRDGAYRWVLDNGRPFTRDGRFAGYFGCCTDIEERKRAEEAQRLLAAELNHRVRNTLASVQAVAHQTLRRASDLETAAETLQRPAARACGGARSGDE
jgi:two-component system, sensor histidine kinase PdtaS